MTPRVAFPSAILGLLLVLLLTLLAGAHFPGFDHASQFISELGARQAPHEHLVRWLGFLPAGILVLLFCASAFRALPRSASTTLGLAGVAVYAVGYVAAAFFPCDPGCRPAQPSVSQQIHNAAGLAGYLLAPLSLALLGWSARRWPGGRYLVAVGLVAAVLCLIGLLALLAPASPFAGWGQRLIEASMLLWACLCGWYLRRARGASGLTS